jgi:hypothetical protein
MPTLDVSTLLKDMLGAAKNSLGNKWPKVKDLATNSFKKLSQVLVDIETMKLAGTISNEQASLMLDMEKNTFKIVMLSVEILGILAVEDALNAALKVVKQTVNTAVGFALVA